jgi:hypothetical protein
MKLNFEWELFEFYLKKIHPFAFRQNDGIFETGFI